MGTKRGTFDFLHAASVVQCLVKAAFVLGVAGAALLAVLPTRSSKPGSRLMAL